jgi:hypothetical protein
MFQPPFTPGRFLIYPRAIVQLEGLGQLKNAMASSGIETANFRLTA